MPHKKIDLKQNQAIDNLSKRVKHVEGEEEVKHVDLLIASADIVAATPLLQNPNLLAVGNTNITRIGNKIAPTSYQCRFRLRADNAQLTESSRVRMIVFWDSQANGAVPSAAGAQGVLDNSVITNLTFAPRNYESLARFKILMDKTYTLEPVLALTEAAGSVTVVSRAQKTVNFVIKANRVIKYSGDTASVTTLVSNAFYVAFYSELTSNPPELDGSIRMYFKDT